jgi:hypothetical protein
MSKGDSSKAQNIILKYARNVVEDIIATPIDDGMYFKTKNVSPIMDEIDI